MIRLARESVYIGVVSHGALPALSSRVYNGSHTEEMNITITRGQVCDFTARTKIYREKSNFPGSPLPGPVFLWGRP